MLSFEQFVPPSILKSLVRYQVVRWVLTIPTSTSTPPLVTWDNYPNCLHPCLVLPTSRIQTLTLRPWWWQWGLLLWWNCFGLHPCEHTKELCSRTTTTSHAKSAIWGTTISQAIQGTQEHGEPGKLWDSRKPKKPLPASKCIWDRYFVWVYLLKIMRPWHWMATGWMK